MVTITFVMTVKSGREDEFVQVAQVAAWNALVRRPMPQGRTPVNSGVGPA